MAYGAMASLSNAARPASSGIRDPYSQPPPQPTGWTAGANNAQQFLINAKNNGLAGSYTDPATGAHWAYDPYADSAASSARTAATAKPTTINDTFDADLARMRSQLAPIPPAPAPAPEVDYSSADRAEFARAKDRIGLIGRGAMDSLQRTLASRNLAGSSIEGKETGNIIQGTQGQLGDVVRDQAIKGAARKDRVADRNTQYWLDARGQDIAAQQNQMQNLMGLMSLLRQSRTASVY